MRAHFHESLLCKKATFAMLVSKQGWPPKSAEPFRHAVEVTSPDALMGTSGDAARLRSACGQPACSCSFIDSFLRPWILRKQPFSFSKWKKGSCKSTVASFGGFAWRSSPLRRCGQPAQPWWAQAFARRLHAVGLAESGSYHALTLWLA